MGRNWMCISLVANMQYTIWRSFRWDPQKSIDFGWYFVETEWVVNKTRTFNTNSTLTFIIARLGCKKWVWSWLWWLDGRMGLSLQQVAICAGSSLQKDLLHLSRCGGFFRGASFYWGSCGSTQDEKGSSNWKMPSSTPVLDGSLYK